MRWYDCCLCRLCIRADADTRATLVALIAELLDALLLELTLRCIWDEVASAADGPSSPRLMLAGGAGSLDANSVLGVIGLALFVADDGTPGLGKADLGVAGGMRAADAPDRASAGGFLGVTELAVAVDAVDADSGREVVEAASDSRLEGAADDDDEIVLAPDATLGVEGAWLPARRARAAVGATFWLEADERDDGVRERDARGEGAGDATADEPGGRALRRRVVVVVAVADAPPGVVGDMRLTRADDETPEAENAGRDCAGGGCVSSSVTPLERASLRTFGKAGTAKTSSSSPPSCACSSATASSSWTWDGRTKTPDKVPGFSRVKYGLPCPTVSREEGRDVPVPSTRVP